MLHSKIFQKTLVLSFDADSVASLNYLHILKNLGPLCDRNIKIFIRQKMDIDKKENEGRKILVIGGGIMGLGSAWYLSQR